jgi:excisionase family DNA binding protein
MTTESEVSVRQACELSGMGRQHIYTLVTQGKIRARKPGGWQLFIDRKSLLAYLARRTTKAQAAAK